MLQAISNVIFHSCAADNDWHETLCGPSVTSKHSNKIRSNNTNFDKLQVSFLGCVKRMNALSKLQAYNRTQLVQLDIAASSYNVSTLHTHNISHSTLSATSKSNVFKLKCQHNDKLQVLAIQLHEVWLFLCHVVS